jgi:hypothetical protein
MWNWQLWTGFVVCVTAFISYILFFYRFPITRNVPWVNWLLFALAGWLLWGGLSRAYRKPELYRGKVFGPILAVLSLAIAGIFGYATLVASKKLPQSSNAPTLGARAPQFELADANGKMVALSALLTEPIPGGAGSSVKPRGVVLIFYRGYW